MICEPVIAAATEIFRKTQSKENETLNEEPCTEQQQEVIIHKRVTASERQRRMKSKENEPTNEEPCAEHDKEVTRASVGEAVQKQYRRLKKGLNETTVREASTAGMQRRVETTLREPYEDDEHQTTPSSLSKMDLHAETQMGNNTENELDCMEEETEVFNIETHFSGKCKSRVLWLNLWYKLLLREVVEQACGMASLQMGEFVPNASNGVDTYCIREPLGVCAGICTFNFSAVISLWMFPIAVTCGNTFILKPSEKNPGASMILAALAMEAGLPDGVLNVVHGTNVPGYEYGNFVGPTILCDITTDMECYKDEIFGPVLLCMQADSLEEAINIVNSNKYVNGASIFTTSGIAARNFQNEIEAGQVGVNVPVPTPLPFSSFNGSEASCSGKEGVQFYTKPKRVAQKWKDLPRRRVALPPPPTSDTEITSRRLSLSQLPTSYSALPLQLVSPSMPSVSDKDLPDQNERDS